MKNVNYIFLFISIVLFSCKSEVPEKVEEASVEKQEIAAPKTENIQKIECYTYLKKKDTIYMALRIKDDSIVEGDLSYSLFEKDQNKGNIRGRISNDSLFASYQYTSEGKVSEREVFFLKSSDGFVEGFTETEESTGKTSFRNKDFKLNYSYTLKRTDCR
ncbi:hypothetical protein ACNI3T_13105 [Christiangramia sp. ASW11-125]|uniref:hypothetical protein n=1 Tax=Christiangramia sp. ASW11-125 TaxID=3400701 RepID=UPI003AACD16A